jgi:quercetin dioxygenase-like cupin family protein
MSRSGKQNKDDSLWPEALDAMIAAPGNHKVLLENDQVRVLDTRIAPGETVPVHTHCWPCVMYVLSFSDFIRYDEHDNVLLDSRSLPKKLEPGEAIWSAPLPPHSLRNVGKSDIRVISMELKGEVNIK